MSSTSLRQTVTIGLSGVVCAVILSAPVAIVEVILVWFTQFSYQPFVSQYTMAVGALIGIAGRVWVIRSQRRRDVGHPKT